MLAKKNMDKVCIKCILVRSDKNQFIFSSPFLPPKNLFISYKNSAARRCVMEFRVHTEVSERTWNEIHKLEKDTDKVGPELIVLNGVI